MTYQGDFTLPDELLEQISTQGIDFIPELIRLLMNAAMKEERQQYLGAAPYQHSPERRGHANGFKPKTLSTRLGEITFDVPQVREGGFYPHALKKGLRSERALTLTLAEMYVQGVSTRKGTAVVEQLCGTSVSSTQVSRAAGQLDETLEAWRNRPLGEIVYLFLDARDEKVRQDGQSRVSRGLSGVQLIISDDMLAWRRPAKRFSGGSPGSAASSISSRTPALTFPAKSCEGKQRLIFVRSSTCLTDRPPKHNCKK